MRSHGRVHLLVVTFLFFIFIAPKAAMAVDLIVSQTSSTCSQPACYPSIQAAIDYANSFLTLPTPTTTSFRVLVEPGTYGEKIILKSNIPVLGRETAKTILSGGGSGPAVTASAVTSINFKNFTITTASLGISVSNNSSVVIENNVFQVGTSGTAIQIQGSPSTQVVNNTFYLNGTAISRDADSVVKNNIFLNNATGISQGAITSQGITYNAFFPITTVGPQGTNFIPNTLVTLIDPLFVDVANFDFHLKAGSPCIDNGDPSITDVIDTTRSDIGAYGGVNADTIPFQISSVNASLSSGDITVSWNANNSYLEGGYRVRYGRVSGVYDGTGATGGPSPITVPTGTAATSYVLSGLTATVTTPAAPVLDQPQPLNNSLQLNWAAVPGATLYKIYYSTSLFDMSSLPTTSYETPDTSFQLSNLTNGQTYYVAVTAVAQAGYYISVTAFDGSIGPFEPGIQHESSFSAPTGPVGAGSAAESALSNMQNDFPEALVAYPDLPNSHTGCFIATAAYGHYSAPQVQALRNFRDKFLITNGPGRAFVEWYYSHGPAAAAWLNNHPEYKPLVRAALLPAVGMSIFLTRTSLAIKIAFLLFAGCFILFLFSGKRLSGSGGLR